jgi:hypothetical protein
MLRSLGSGPAVTLVVSALAAQAPAPIDPPPVDEAALVERLVEMAKPERGEKAIILYDPTYYPGITARLRDVLDARGVNSYAIVEETPAMIAAYDTDEGAQMRREEEVVATLGPLFEASDIFYWMPLRDYAGDMRWERLVAESRVRSVHFHWLLWFPGTRTPAEILATSREIERKALDVDLSDHARGQERLAAALRGQKVRITTPGGTDLVMDVAPDEWFHHGDGNASRARAATARSVRDRQQELPVGMFVFTPDADTVEGTVLAPSIAQAGTLVKDVHLRLSRGRVTEMSGTGTDWIRERIAVIGPDGDKIAAISLNTNPVGVPDVIGLALGSNWEEAEPRRRNRPTRIRRMSIRMRDATLTAGGKTIVRDGRILWELF